MAQLRIKEVCKEKGISINDLAKTVKMSRVSISNMIAGRQSPPVDTLEKIAIALGVEVWVLLKSPDELEITPFYKCPKCGAKLMLVEYVEEPLTLAKPQKEAGEEKESKE